MFKNFKILWIQVYFVDEINEKLTNVNHFSSDLKKTEGSHCYATIKQI